MQSALDQLSYVKKTERKKGYEIKETKYYSLVLVWRDECGPPEEE